MASSTKRLPCRRQPPGTRSWAYVDKFAQPLSARVMDPARCKGLLLLSEDDSSTGADSGCQGDR